jgi:hypothetical protein
MANGKEVWASAEKLVDKGGARSANAMRFYALTRMLAEAETAMLTGGDMEAADLVRELQAHCEKMIAILAPERKKGPTLVAA